MKRLLMSVTAALLAVFVFAAPQVRAADAPPPDGRIMYVDTSEAGKTYLAFINPDGTGKERITPAYSNIVFPRLCEVSGWIGFTNKLPDMRSEVYLLSRDGKKIKKILDGSALEGFSPDGRFLLYTTCDKEAGLYTYSIEHKTAVKLSQNLRVTAADWSPSGDWIAVSVMVDDGTNDLYMISTLAQGIIRLTDTKGVNESFPCFTKDGKSLVFISDRYGSSELEYLDLTSKQLHRPIITGLYPSLSPSNLWVTFENGEHVHACRANGLDLKMVAQGRTPCWVK
ncbi:MAG TPA: DUF5050 domain-containing protein [Candidatus Ozemobacteraceae bacterium]|nr:DUF5050 domain-containing protein [Candidatus Ozemobacteraceae bacterium]